MRLVKVEVKGLGVDAVLVLHLARVLGLVRQLGALQKSPPSYPLLSSSGPNVSHGDLEGVGELVGLLGIGFGNSLHALSDLEKGSSVPWNRQQATIYPL